jgi:alpha-ribazole phosphatase
MRSGAENQINLVLIRHGETTCNEAGKYIGRTDEGLSEQGRELLASYKKAGMYPEEGILVSSPMKRCQETVRVLYGCRRPILIEEWREIDFGRFEGKNYLELCGDKDYQAWLDSNGELPFPEGESKDEFVLRCRKGLRKLSRIIAGDNTGPSVVIAVVHGGTIMALLSSFGRGEYYDYQCWNGEGYHCRLETNREGEPRLEVVEKLERKNG